MLRWNNHAVILDQKKEGGSEAILKCEKFKSKNIIKK